MARAPFSLFTKNLKSGKVWYVRYYNPENDSYDVTKSTGVKCTGKKGRRVEAYEWARSHIPNREPESQNLLAYLEKFWSEDSEYLRMKRIVEKKEFSHDYVNLSASGLDLHVKPYSKLKNIKLKDLKPGMIEDWKLWALEKGVGVRRVNTILASIRTAVRFAVSRGDLERDPLQSVKKVPYKPKDKGILNFEEAKKIIEVGEEDQRIYLAVLLGLLTGMRRGEVRGLLWEDIDLENKIINVQHNFVNADGLKGCKWDSSRKVPVHSALIPAITAVRNMSERTGPKDFVLFNLYKPDEPCSNELLRSGFNRMLRNINIHTSTRKERNITFHSLRHTFVTLARVSGLPDITVQALAGHKTSQMMEHYSHGEKVIDFQEVADRILKKII